MNDIGVTSGNARKQLLLPDELVLLLHKEDGTHHPISAPTPATLAARVGELVARSRIAFEDGKLTVIDQSPVGIDWCDELLAKIAQKSGASGKPVALSTLLSFEAGVFGNHREVLVENGLLRKETTKTLRLFKSVRWYPDTEQRAAALAHLRGVARPEAELDERSVLLASIVHASGLLRHLDLTSAETDRIAQIARGEGIGSSVKANASAAAVAIAATMTTVLVTTSGE